MNRLLETKTEKLILFLILFEVQNQKFIKQNQKLKIDRTEGEQKLTQ